MRFSIKGYESPSNNNFTYSHWSVYKKEKDRIFNLITGAYQACKARPEDWHNDRVFVVKFIAYRKRTLDDDNLIGGLKAARDCLTRMEFIKDDAPKWCKFQYEQFVRKDSPFADANGKPCCGLIIEITSLDPNSSQL